MEHPEVVDCVWGKNKSHPNNPWVLFKHVCVYMHINSSSIYIKSCLNL